jgi:hypothetical protein
VGARVSVVAVVVALACVASALAAPGDPRRHLTAADQARAKSLILKQADLPADAWKTTQTNFTQANPPCIVKHYSLSALTLTGEAGLTYTDPAGIPLVESDGDVFLTPAQAQRSVTVSTESGFANCVGSALAARLKAGVPSSATVSFNTSTFVLAGFADPVRGFKIHVLIRSGTIGESFNVTQFAAIKGRAVAHMALIRRDAEWPLASVRSLAAKLVARLGT